MDVPDKDQESPRRRPLRASPWHRYVESAVRSARSDAALSAAPAAPPDSRTSAGRAPGNGVPAGGWLPGHGVAGAPRGVGQRRAEGVDVGRRGGARERWQKPGWQFRTSQ